MSERPLAERVESRRASERARKAREVRAHLTLTASRRAQDLQRTALALANKLEVFSILAADDQVDMARHPQRLSELHFLMERIDVHLELVREEVTRYESFVKE